MKKYISPEAILLPLFFLAMPIMGLVIVAITHTINLFK